MRTVVGGAVLAVLSCHRGPSVPGADAEATAVPASSPPVTAPALAAASPVDRTPRRHLLLGRVVDFQTLRAEHDLTSTGPEEELSDPEGDFGAVLHRSGELEGYRLSTGARLWARTPFAPCRRVALGGAHLYAHCGNKLLAFRVSDGREQIVDNAPTQRQAIVVGSVVVSLHKSGPGHPNHGRAILFEVDTHRRLRTAVLPELVRSTFDVLLPNPEGAGICVVGQEPDRLQERTGTYHAGCYDERLASTWRKRLPRRPSGGLFDLRQFGPTHLVLDDQENPSDFRQPAGPGQGLVVRWRDGQVAPFDDGTFATLETAAGDRVTAPPALEAFARTKELRSDHDYLPRREARVAVAGQRAFALIINGATALAAIDLATNLPLFLLPVPIGATDNQLSVVAGYPVVRTVLRDQWRATIHDPTTGRVLYADIRPSR